MPKDGGTKPDAGFHRNKPDLRIFAATKGL